jgi:TRAP-type C4-dicarboxylate transport system permease small subunit
MNQVNKAARSLDTVISQASRVINVIGIISLVVMMLITVADVSLRYVFSRPITGSVELTQYLMAVIGFFGLAWCAVKAGHAKVDLLVTRFPPRSQAIIDGVIYLMGLTVTLFVAWQGIEASNYARGIGEYSFMLEIPSYPFYMAQGIGFTMLSLVIAGLMVKSIVKAVKG